MDDRTLEALKGSIAKWEAVVAGTGKDDRSENCPLCRLFINEPKRASDDDHIVGYCHGCPVVEAVSNDGCRDTPYAEWSAHHKRDHAQPFGPLSVVTDCAECTRLAQAEIDFLRGLMPAEAQP